jgi:hypothetical protein
MIEIKTDTNVSLNRSKIITLNKNRSSSNEDAVHYYTSMTHYIERLRKLHKSLRDTIKYGDKCKSFLFPDMFSFFRDEVNKLLKEASDDEAVGISILVTVLIVSPIIIMLVQNAVATIQVKQQRQ